MNLFLFYQFYAIYVGKGSAKTGHSPEHLKQLLYESASIFGDKVIFSVCGCSHKDCVGLIALTNASIWLIHPAPSCSINDSWNKSRDVFLQQYQNKKQFVWSLATRCLHDGCLGCISRQLWKQRRSRQARSKSLDKSFNLCTVNLRNTSSGSHQRTLSLPTACSLNSQTSNRMFI